ncbi:MAG: ABC transporter permease subunit [Syntrophomonadaceae bacterium]|nr:ABC transporter permease subunit [Syntrophomonadaceae bacterium]
MGGLVRNINSYRGTLVMIAMLLVLFELATDIFHWLDPILFPGFSKIGPALLESLPQLKEGLISSLGLLVPSYLLALTTGVGMGLVIGRYEPLRKNLMPIFHGISPIPPTLYIPYALAILPTFWLSSTFIIFIGSLWPILMGTIHGVVLLEGRYLDNARALELKGWKMLTRIILPAASPMIFNGAGIALVFAFILLTVAEMFGAKSGLGYFIQLNADFSEYGRVLAGLIFMSTFIVLVMGLFEAIQRRSLHWTNKR